MTIEELIAEELTEDPETERASEPIRVALDAEGEFVVVETRDRQPRGSEARP